MSEGVARNEFLPAVVSARSGGVFTRIGGRKGIVDDVENSVSESFETT